MIRVHYIDGDSGHVYGVSQCSDEVRDGDVLVALRHDPPQVAVLNLAWPMLVVPAEHPGEPACFFHGFKPGATIDTIDEGKYAESARIARNLDDPAVVVGIDQR